MKKQAKILTGLLIGVFTFSGSTYAQSEFHFFKKDRKVLKSQEKALQILNIQQKGIQNKTTATQERVIAQSFYDMEYQILVDSTHYTYLGTRGSKYNFNDLDFSYNTDLDNDRLGINDMVINNTALADTVKRFEDGLGVLTDVYAGYYRSDNQLDSIIEGYDDGTGMTYRKLTNSFNSSGHLIETKRVDVLTSEMYSKTVYAYNNDFSKYIADSTFSYTPNPELTELIVYSYNANNKIDSILYYYQNWGSLELSNKTVMQYYPNGKLKEMHTYESDGTNLSLYEINRYTHHTTLESPATWEQVNFNNGSLTDSLFVTIGLGSNGYPDSLKATMTDDNEITNILVTMEYNAANNPIRVKQTFDGDLNFTVNYYYEEYNDDPTSINNVQNDFAVIFPNPFNERINISLKETPKSISEISLKDVLGRQVFSQKSQLNAGNNLISLPKIPTGLYMLHISNPETGQLTKKLIKE